MSKDEAYAFSRALSIIPALILELQGLMPCCQYSVWYLDCVCVYL